MMGWQPCGLGRGLRIADERPPKREAQPTLRCPTNSSAPNGVYISVLSPQVRGASRTPCAPDAGSARCGLLRQAESPPGQQEPARAPRARRDGPGGSDRVSVGCSCSPQPRGWPLVAAGAHRSCPRCSRSRGDGLAARACSTPCAAPRTRGMVPFRSAPERAFTAQSPTGCPARPGRGQCLLTPKKSSQLVSLR